VGKICKQRCGGGDKGAGKVERKVWVVEILNRFFAGRKVTASFVPEAVFDGKVGVAKTSA